MIDFRLNGRGCAGNAVSGRAGVPTKTTIRAGTGCFAIVALAVSVLAPMRASAVVLDWSAVTWPAGSLSETYTNIDPNSPGSSVTVTISGDTSAFRSGYPINKSSPITGGTLGDTNLQLVLKFPNTSSNITVTVQFNYGGAGVQNVNFGLFDIDNGKSGGKVVYVDQISAIAGQFGTNAPVSATVTNLPGTPTYSVANNGTLNATITGTSNNADNKGNGNATIDFGTNLIDQFTFTYGNGPGVQAGPNQQAIGMFDISWVPKVPEQGTALAAMIVCGLAVGWRTMRPGRSVSVQDLAPTQGTDFASHPTEVHPGEHR